MVWVCALDVALGCIVSVGGLVGRGAGVVGDGHGGRTPQSKKCTCRYTPPLSVSTCGLELLELLK